MCGDSYLPAAPESADRVAIIHPFNTPTSSPLFQGRLRLFNGEGGVTSTTLEGMHGSSDPHGEDPAARWNIRIQ